MSSDYPLITLKDIKITIQITNQSQWDFIYGVKLIEQRKHFLANYLTSMIEKKQSQQQELSLQMKIIDSFLQYIRLDLLNIYLQ